MFQLMDKKIIAILRSKILLNWPYDLNLYLLLCIVYELALFQHLCFQKVLGITITVTNLLGFLSFVWPVLGRNYLQRLSAEDTSGQRVNCSRSWLDNDFKLIWSMKQPESNSKTKLHKFTQTAPAPFN